MSRNIKFCAILHEAQHNDARTNLAIALSASVRASFADQFFCQLKGLREDWTINSTRRWVAHWHAQEHGADIVNYTEVTSFLTNAGEPQEPFFGIRSHESTERVLTE